MKVYHGTNSEFERFNLENLGMNTDDNASSEAMAQTAHIGIWFTDNADKAAEVYEKVMECELSMENPMEIDTLETLEYWVESQDMSGEELREMLQEQGYDGIIINEDEEFEGTSYIVFSADQITIL